MKKKRRALALAAFVRRATEEQYPRCKTLRNRCLITTFCLHRLFCDDQIPGEIMCGFYERRPHTWLESDSHILDLTLTQFCRSTAKVTLLKHSHPSYVRHHFAMPALVEIELRLRGVHHEAVKIIDRACRYRDAPQMIRSARPALG